ncbi:MAG: hypothetical protein HOO93_01655 [Methyloglobulus sp.]|nr:hypothetical protein [Methyloglobulus sp.]
MIGSKPYFWGDKPNRRDASAYGVLVNTLSCPFGSPLKDHALTKQNLLEHCRRMQIEFPPDLYFLEVKIWFLKSPHPSPPAGEGTSVPNFEVR